MVIHYIREERDVTEAFCLLPERWRGNREVVLAAVRTGRATHLNAFVREDLSGDREIALELVRVHDIAFASLSEELQHDKPFVLLALQANRDVFVWVPFELQTDPDVQRAARQHERDRAVETENTPPRPRLMDEPD